MFLNFISLLFLARLVIFFVITLALSYLLVINKKKKSCLASVRQ